MARMHSRARGQSGSTKPLKAKVPTWVRYQTREIEMLVSKLSKEGNTPSMIGTILRDSYGVPDVKLITGKSITQVLKEKKLAKEIPEDLMALMKRSVLIRKHLEKNHKDTTAIRGLQLTESKIGRLAKYYKKQKVLPVDWKYDPAKIALVTE